MPAKKGGHPSKDMDGGLSSIMAQVQLNSPAEVEEEKKLVSTIMFIFKNKDGKKFVPTNQTFVFDPSIPIHLALVEEHKEKVLQQALELGIEYEILVMNAEAKGGIDAVGGLSSGFKSLVFPPQKHNNWLPKNREDTA